MIATPLATVPVTFFDRHTGLSALAVQHLHVGGRLAIVYHDAPSITAARPLLAGVAETLLTELAPGQLLGVIECSVPEHAAEPYIYARVSLSVNAASGRVHVGPGRVVAADAVAAACGVAPRELARTEALVAAVHRPRRCAFPGFRQLALRDREARPLVA